MPAGRKDLASAGTEDAIGPSLGTRLRDNNNWGVVLPAEQGPRVVIIVCSSAYRMYFLSRRPSATLGQSESQEKDSAWR